MPLISHEPIKQFYAETTREEPFNGKRNFEIFLASGEDMVSRAGRPKGSTKAARAAADASVVQKLSFVQQTLLSPPTPRFFEAEFPK